MSNGLGDDRNVSDLIGDFGSHHVHIIRQVFPSATDVFYDRLSAQDAFGTDLERDPSDFGRKDR